MPFLLSPASYYSLTPLFFQIRKGLILFKVCYQAAHTLGFMHPATRLALSVLHCSIFRVAHILGVKYHWTDSGLVWLSRLHLLCIISSAGSNELKSAYVHMAKPSVSIQQLENQGKLLTDFRSHEKKLLPGSWICILFSEKDQILFFQTKIWVQINFSK